MLRRILINGKLLGDPVTGVQRHAWELVTCLVERRPAVQVAVPARWSPPAGYGLPEDRVLRLGSGGGHVWQQAALPRRLAGGAVLWTPGGLGPLRARRHILTVHDLSVLDHPEWFAPAFRWAYRILLPALVRRAVHLFVPSDFSRARLQERLGVPPERITKVPNAVPRGLAAPLAPEEARGRRSRLGLPADYLLAVGTIEPRKNLPVLVRAVARLSGEHPGLALVVVGGRHPNFRPVALPADGIRLEVLDGEIGDADLRAIYEGARALAFPSQYEGFGLPLLEAMACGTPVVAAGATSVPEVAGGAAVLVPPGDGPALAEALRQVLVDSALRRRLAEAGRTQAARFRWEEGADHIWEVLNRLAT